MRAAVPDEERILIAVDTSASISENVLWSFMNLSTRLGLYLRDVKGIDVDLVLFDTNIYYSYDLTARKDFNEVMLEREGMVLRRGGGTDIDDVNIKSSDKYKAVVIFTDGDYPKQKMSLVGSSYTVFYDHNGYHMEAIV